MAIKRQMWLVLLLIGLVIFVLFIPANSTGAKDPAMIAIFEPDESAQYAHPIRMLNFDASFPVTLRRFINYQHYYYGYPFYFSSAVIVLLPVKLIMGLENTSINLLFLRQIISVLPMIMAIILLVYLQTRFRSYFTSVGLLVFLFSVPAVFKNNTWWHPDSLVLLFIVLTFFFLDRDNLRFGKNFYFAAMACGLATATKLLGLFFFIAIPLYLLLGLLNKRLTGRQAVISGMLFVILMVVVFILANPFLLDADQRSFALKTQIKQARAMSVGWNLQYSKGPLAWYPMIKEMYGHILFLSVVFCMVILSIWKNHHRLLNILILAWALPFLIYVLSTIVIKPTHFLLPAALLLYSGLGYLFHSVEALWSGKEKLAMGSGLAYPVLGGVAILVVGFQFVTNISWDFHHYQHSLSREQKNETIQFFSELEEEYLSQLPENVRLKTLCDVRTYCPARKNLSIEYRSKPLSYTLINTKNIEFIVIWNQRALDYTIEGVLEIAIDKNEILAAHRIYQDALSDNIAGYVQISKSACCSAYLQKDIHQRYFP